MELVYSENDARIVTSTASVGHRKGYGDNLVMPLRCTAPAPRPATPSWYSRLAARENMRLPSRFNMICGTVFGNW